MSRLAKLQLVTILLATLSLSSVDAAEKSGQFGYGKPASEVEIAGWDIDNPVQLWAGILNYRTAAPYSLFAFPVSCSQSENGTSVMALNGGELPDRVHVRG